ncbi:MAG: hypothetical protein WAU83_07175, partial [Pseudonocardiaceae bacterium]
LRPRPRAAKSTPHSPTARSSASERPVPLADLTPEPFPGLLVPLFLEGRLQTGQTYDETKAFPTTKPVAA